MAGLIFDFLLTKFTNKIRIDGTEMFNMFEYFRQ